MGSPVEAATAAGAMRTTAAIWPLPEAAATLIRRRDLRGRAAAAGGATRLDVDMAPPPGADPEPTARELTVRGRVQGVFFRAFVRAEAERRGVRGRATNEADGTVRVHLEGDPEAVAAVAAACGRGPSGARVDRVEERDAAPEGLIGFAIG
ncbi:MAG: acylphosphatase [Solirubrobacterales bacterium]